ncbi:MAG: DUF378 domain-containing protein [Lysobacteraceae bacterium]|jgi:uncharacterized membrane protein YuzA (DUF378 family)|nr:MAG: DUF378 domain-containing protein [Xanthomonadaceae bacterium]
MKALNLFTLVLVIIGGLNWGLVGAAQFDLVATLFGGQQAPLARVVYVLVGLSAVWQLIGLLRGTSASQARVPTHR